MKRSFLYHTMLIVLSAFPLLLNAQTSKPALDHSVYDGWKNAGNVTVFNDGEWGQFYLSPQEGDGTIEFYNLKTGRQISIERGQQVRFSKDATRAIFKIIPKFQETRQAKIDKKKPKDMPKDTLGILNLITGEVTKFPLLKNFKSGVLTGDYIAFQKDTVSNLYILNIKTMALDSVKSVSEYDFSRENDILTYTTKPDPKKDSTTVPGIYLLNPATGVTTTIIQGSKDATFGNTYFTEDGSKMAFYANTDTTKEAKKFTNIYLYDGTETRVLVPKDAEWIPEGWMVSDKGSISFSKSGDYITYGTCPIPREKDTTLVDFEQPKLDIWSWNEDYIQPIQLKNLSREQRRTYLAKINIDGTNPVQLADMEVESIGIGDENKEQYVITYTDKPYRMSQQWDLNPKNDIYKVSLADGSKELIAKGAPFNMLSSSPDGKYYTFYDAEARIWYLYTLATGEIKDLTSALGVIFYNEDHDTPSLPRPYSNAVWSENSDYFIIRDRYDYWQFDPTGAKAPFLLTEGKGRATNTTYTFVNPYNDPKSFMGRSSKINAGKPIYFRTFDRTTKETGFAMKDVTKRRATLQQLVKGPYAYDAMGICTTGKKPIYIYSRGRFEDGNNIWMTSDNFNTQVQVTDANPQQRDYNWGTVELVSWNTEDGIRAEGLLFKPENFDPSKKYPLMIYFYEKYSDDLYAPRTPSPSRSTVNIPYFVSNEYIVFVPDIYYTDGHPGQSAMKSIMPACDMLCENPWIDGDNMAIQGQSWGGYQVAYMITQTNRFKAAGSGAPVSNMTSAYGGIRWESGMARTFQYEQQQSRIGKDLWEGFDLYIENSPLFFVPNVTTPVLIMHNDEDGAVPWWQGIEFFNALRRCGKEAWMLQYNGEAHNLRERRNARDLSIRLEQFFDHYLKGKPAPVWMSKGIPATLKGIDLGYGYEQ